MQLLVGLRFPGARLLRCGGLRREGDVVGAGGRGLRCVRREGTDGSAEPFFDAAQTAIEELLHRGCEVRGGRAAVSANAWRRRRVSMRLCIGTAAGLTASLEAVPGKCGPPGRFSCPWGIGAVPSPGRVAARRCAAEECA